MTILKSWRQSSECLRMCRQLWLPTLAQEILGNLSMVSEEGRVWEGKGTLQRCDARVCLSTLKWPFPPGQLISVIRTKEANSEFSPTVSWLTPKTTSTGSMKYYWKHFQAQNQARVKWYLQNLTELNSSINLCKSEPAWLFCIRVLIP